MIIVQVYIRVKEKEINQFISATIENAQKSIHEPGIIRFDFMQEVDDPQSFLLTEIYKDVDAPGEHKKTAHYLIWRERVADMMAEPRKGIQYHAIFPSEEIGWKSTNE